MSAPAANIVKAAGVVIYRRVTATSPIEYLLLQASTQGHWTPPKGRLEEGEDLMLAAVREVKEEAGLTRRDDYVIDESFKSTISYQVNGKPKEVTYYLGKLLEGKEVKLSHEHKNFSWNPIQKTLELSNFPEMNKVFNIIEDMLKLYSGDGVVRAAGMVMYRRPTPTGPVEYLLLQTSYGIHHWTPPKGHVDPGEDLFLTAVRETEEEAGLSREHYDLDESFKSTIGYKVRNKPKEVTYYIAKIKDGCEVKLSQEHQDFSWNPLAKTLELSNFPEMNEAFESIEKHLNKEA